jgi:hypothetical protein
MGLCAGGVVGGVVCLALIAAGLLLCTGRWKPLRSEEKTKNRSSGQEDPMFDHYNADSGQVISPPLSSTHRAPTHPSCSWITRPKFAWSKVSALPKYSRVLVLSFGKDSLV